MKALATNFLRYTSKHIVKLSTKKEKKTIKILKKKSWQIIKIIKWVKTKEKLIRSLIWI